MVQRTTHTLFKKKTVKLLKEENLYELGIGRDFLDHRTNHKRRKQAVSDEKVKLEESFAMHIFDNLFLQHINKYYNSTIRQTTKLK